MKKFGTLWLVLALVFALVGCADQETEKSLYAHGLELISLMEEMVENEDYFALYTANPEMAEVVAPVREGDYAKPKAVYRITIGEDMIAALGGVESMEGISQPLKDYILSRTYGAIPSQINAAEGAQVLAAASICTAGKTFVNSELTGSALYLYTFETGVPAMVTFTAGEEHTVSATGCFLFNRELTTASAEEVAAYFQQMQATAVLVEE